MSHLTPLDVPKNQTRRVLNVEEIILMIGLACFGLFVSFLAILFYSLSSQTEVKRTQNDLNVVVMVTPRATEFILPPTWTPTVTPLVIPTMVPTPVFTGTPEVHVPHPPSPRDPMKFQLRLFKFDFPMTGSHDDIIDLARIIQGESPGDKEAAYRVGWVAKNRFKTKGYGRNYYEVSSGFFGYRASMQPSKEFIEIAKRIMRSPKDPTNGCLYALSRTDITHLGVPASRADVAYGEWFFFKTWPLSPKRH